MSSRVPEAPYPGGKAQGEVNWLVRQEPVERDAEVGMHFRESIQPADLIDSGQPRRCCFREIKHVRCVAAHAVLELAGLLQLFQPKFAKCLQHVEMRQIAHASHVPDQTLVDE